MKHEYLLAALFITLAATIFYLAFLVFQPFFVAICWGIILAMIFFPLYVKLRGKVKNKTFSSILMCLLIFIIIIGPFIYLGIVLVDQAVKAYYDIETHIRSGEYQPLLKIAEHPYFISLRQRVEQYVDLSEINVPSQILGVLNQIQSFVLSQIRNIVQGFSQFVLHLIFIFLTMYYLFKDGEGLIDKFKGVIPLSEYQTNFILTQLRVVSRATIYGGVIVALIQGFLGGIAFLILGIASPVFWGSIMMLSSFVPLVGSWLILLPTIIILLIQGSFIKGLILLLWGIGAVSMVDNILRPYFVSGRTQIHPLVLFFSILGGLQVFGFLGIVVGPMLASVFVVLLNILQSQLQESKV